MPIMEASNCHQEWAGRRFAATTRHEEASQLLMVDTHVEPGPESHCWGGSGVLCSKRCQAALLIFPVFFFLFP